MQRGRNNTGGSDAAPGTPGWSIAELPPNEDVRLEVLRRYALLDTPPESSYDEITGLAARICGAPIALMVLLDDRRQWFKSRVGLDATETPREQAFCAHAILGRELFVVEDAHADPRFAGNPLVLGEPHVRFYAGAPLVNAEDLALGTLCVIDRVPKQLTELQRRSLEVLAHQIVVQMELRRTQAQLCSSVERARQLSAVVEQTGDIVLMTDRDARIVYVNKSFETQTGWRSHEIIGRTPGVVRADLQGTEELSCDAVVEQLQSGEIYRGTMLHKRKDGTTFRGEHTITPITDPTDGRVYFVSVCRDITERERAEVQDAELRLAAEVQKRLYPQAPPGIEGFDIAGMCMPASQTCGDYYDYVPLQDGTLGLVVGDMAGHGFGPALIMSSTRAFLRSLLLTGHTPRDTYRHLACWLSPDLADDAFMTLLTVFLDPVSRQICHVNAGHSPGFVLDQHGALRFDLGVSGPALGLSPNCSYFCSRPRQLQTGDTIVLVSDGITEARSPAGDLLGRDRLERIVARHCQLPAVAILERVREELVAHTGGCDREDDQTMVVCRVLEQGPKRALWALRAEAGRACCAAAPEAST